MDTLLVVFTIENALGRELATIVLLLFLAHIPPPFLYGRKDELPCLGNTVVAHFTLGRVVHDAVDNAIQ
jgi:hypothetical protein